MTTVPLAQLLPYLLPTAGLFALIGWLLGKKKAVPAPAPAATAKTAAPSNSERQRLRDAEAKLRAAEASLATTSAELSSLKSSSVPKAQHDTLAADLDLARTNAAALEAQLKKSRDVQATLQSQANDAGKKIQTRAITLENDLSTARTEIQRLLTLSGPNTDGMKRLEGEIETVRTRLRAVEAQLAERNAELNALKASALASTARPPRTIAPRDTTPGASLNLLGVDLTPMPPAPVSSTAAAASADSTPAASSAPAPAAELAASGVDAPTPAAPATPAAPETAAASVAPAPAAPEANFTSATAILGKPIQADDLTLIEGIGPAISQILQTAGLNSWTALADATPETLESLLAEAGPAFAAHHPGTWPEQARLAADAKWFQLKSLQSKLQAGHPPETAMV